MTLLEYLIRQTDPRVLWGLCFLIPYLRLPTLLTSTLSFTALTAIGFAVMTVTQPYVVGRPLWEIAYIALFLFTVFYPMRVTAACIEVMQDERRSEEMLRYLEKSLTWAYWQERPVLAWRWFKEHFIDNDFY